MESRLIEHLALMYESIQALEGMPDAWSGRESGMAAIGNLRALAANAPALLRQTRPSIPWRELSRIGTGRGTESGRERELVQRLKSAILDEFGLDSGTLAYCGRTGCSYAAIFDTELEGRRARLLFLDGILSSAEYGDGSPALLYPPFAMRSFELLDKAREGLVIGVAGGTMVEVLKRAFGEIHVDGVDIDAGVMELGRKYFSLREDGRTSLHVADGRGFIRESGKKYDIAIVDAFAGIKPIPHLSTAEFAQELRAAMNPGGVCVINIIARVERGGYLQHCYGTWRSAFSSVVAMPLCTEGDIFNVVLVATDAKTKEFEARNRHLIYPMEFDPAKILTDANNRTGELSPY
jgi:spermidine synthase